MPAEKSREGVPTIVRTIVAGPREGRQKGLVVCLSRLLMAVFGRVRNWRVCTRSLYTVAPLSPFLYLFVSLSPLPSSSPRSFSPYRPFAARRFPPSFAVALVALPFPRNVDVSFLFPSSRFLCHPLRMFPRASRRVVLYRVAFSYCRCPPFTQPFILREYSSAIRKANAATFR